VDRETVEEMQEQLAALTEVIERQNQKINDQEETLMQLIDELRRGR
jgi:peptidoglycan hydrolase CwlO-like protein